MNTRVRRLLNGIRGIINRCRTGMRKCADDGLAYFIRNGADSLKIAGRSRGKTRFNDIHTEIFQLPGNFQFFLDIQGPAGSLFAVS